jgi:hypothetical protein
VELRRDDRRRRRPASCLDGRAEYTIGVEGCGQKATYVVVCPLGSPGCVAVAGRNLVQ